MGDEQQPVAGFTLLVGGARSGKSNLAVALGERHAAGGGEVIFLATAPPALDDDLDERIRRHRAERPDWPTVEEPLELTAAVGAVDAASRSSGALVIVDCVTLWVSNLLFADESGGIESAEDDSGWTAIDERIVDHADRLGAHLAARPGPTVVISNEVGFGIHPESSLGRRYRDVLGRANQRLAGHADRTLLLVAGRALRLDDPWALLELPTSR